MASIRRPRALLGVLACVAITPVAQAQATESRMDGRFDEWPAGVVARADAEWIYFRVRDPAHVSLQAAPVETVIELDLDDDHTTGDTVARWTMPDPDATTLGVDLRIHISPLADPPGDARAGSGVFAVQFGASGAGVQSVYDIGFGFLPTYDADEYEMRVSRSVVPAIRNAKGVVRGRVFRVEHDPDLKGQLLVHELTGDFEIDLADAPSDRGVVRAAVPKRAEDELRIVSWNVLWATPMQNPLPYGRVLKALDPDVLLLQEWDLRSFDAPVVAAEQIAAWLNEHAGEHWSAHRGADRGVVVATRRPMTPLQTAVADTPNRNVRFVGARVTTPACEAVIGSAHLKCCGATGSIEDVTRMSETTAIAEAIGAAATAAGARLVIVGGDLNLVGSREPLDLLIAGLKQHGFTAVTADPVSLGGNAAFTWREVDSPFSPGRLDYIVVASPGGPPSIARAFVLDADALSPAALYAAGLQAGDTGYSDHLPIVVDIRPD